MEKGYKNKNLSNLEAIVDLETNRVKIWSADGKDSYKLIMDTLATAVTKSDAWYCPADEEKEEIDRLRALASEPKVYSTTEMKSLIREALTSVYVKWYNDGSGHAFIDETDYDKFIKDNL